MRYRVQNLRNQRKAIKEVCQLLILIITKKMGTHVRVFNSYVYVCLEQYDLRSVLKLFVFFIFLFSQLVETASWVYRSHNRLSGSSEEGLCDLVAISGRFESLDAFLWREFSLNVRGSLCLIHTQAANVT